MIGKSINTLLKANSVLVGLISGRIFPYVMEENTPLPSVIYTIDSVDPEYNKGARANDMVTFSVHSWHTIYENLQPIVTAIRTALELQLLPNESAGRITMTGFVEGFDQTNQAYYNQLNFKVNIKSY